MLMVMSSAPPAIEGGDLAYGSGDGAEVLAQDVVVLAGDLRVDLDVRVAFDHLLEAGADAFPSQLRPRSVHIPGRDGDVVQHGAQFALARDHADLDVAFRHLF